jgi:flagellar motor switch protein FliG
VDGPRVVGELIRNEHPQIIASILVHLERDHACGVLQQFNERTRTDVMLRIATLDGIQPNALRELNDVLSKVLAGGDRMKKAKLGGSKTAAEILNFMGGSAGCGDRWTRSGIRPRPGAEDPRPDVHLRRPEQARRQGHPGWCCAKCQSDALVIALKSADPDLREKIFKQHELSAPPRRCAKTWSPRARCASPRSKPSRRKS